MDTLSAGGRRTLNGQAVPDPSLVAQPVWQALQREGTKALRDIGREGSGSALTAVGFPVDPVVTPDATRIELSGGSLGKGALLHQDGQDTWRWEPERSFDASARSGGAHFSPAKLRLGVETTICWAVPRLQIEDERYQALPSILEGDDLTCAIAELSAQPLRGIHWQKREESRRNRSLVTFIGGPEDGPSWAMVNTKLFRRRYVTYVATSSFLTIGDLPAWRDRRIRKRPDRTSLLSRDELTGYMSAAWYTITEIMPALVVADPVAVPPVYAPRGSNEPKSFSRPRDVKPS